MSAGLCGCGCGEQTPLAPRTYSSMGIFKGQPRPFIPGHALRGACRDMAERFSEKVDRSAGLGPNGDCHLWRASINHYGYGKFSVARGRWERAHRVAWFLATGSWPELNVLHHCDTPACVRFEHLFLGTTADNHADMVAKRRHPFGERHYAAKITSEQAREIRALRGSVPLVELGRRFGISRSTVSEIQRGEAWVLS